ncbi:MAG: hypothetical protein EBT48_01690, partial [Verrucomicrobia bacterium]|nr:hypothetical protein [Verrucomicrobiota bacterium]
MKDTLSRIELPPGATIEESYSNTGSRPTRTSILLKIYARSGSSGQVAPVTEVTLVLGGTDSSRFSLLDASLSYTPVVNEDL